MMSIESAMTLSICQFRIVEGACRVAITTMESPSMVNFLAPLML
jgi:flagellar assembly factor FliW